MPAIHNPLFTKYGLACTWPGCTGKTQVEQAMSAGWSVGYLVPEDPSHPEVGRCPRCRRCMMKVVTAPEPPLPPKPVGWNKIPTK